MPKRKDVQLDVDSANIARIAPLRLANTGINKIAKELNLTGHYVSKILDTVEFRTALSTIAEEASNHAVSSWKHSVAQLVPEAIEVLKVALADNDLEAVKLVMKSLGIEKQEANVQEGNITVVLPSGTDFKQVTSEVIDVETD